MEFNLIYRALHREMASNFALLRGKIMLPCNNQVAPIIASAHALQANIFIYSFAPHYHQYVQKGTPNIIIY